jgi:DNA-binding MarR family transcriptional regulator
MNPELATYRRASDISVGQAPAESDLQRYFRVSAPAVHDMIKNLERNGLIQRTPGQARSIRLLVRAEYLPPLEPES